MSLNAHHRSVGIFLLPRFNMMTLTSVIEPMRIANYIATDEVFSWKYRAAEDGPVFASNGLPVECKQVNVDDDPNFDIAVVFGSWGAEKHRDPILLSWLRAQARKGNTLVGAELGVYSLAHAGLLSGKTVTTHWSCKQGLMESYPNTEVCEQIYTIDGNIMSCAGATAGLDLMIELISQIHGEQLAGEVSNQVLNYPRRSATTPQRYIAGSTMKDVHPDVRRAIGVLEANIEEPLTIPQLCKELQVSQRSLERLFVRDTGCTIVQISKLLRLQYARVLLTSTTMSVREVSVACGFNSLSYFSQCFSTMFEKRPSEYRQAWPDNEAAPSWPGTVYSFMQNIRSEQSSYDAGP